MRLTLTTMMRMTTMITLTTMIRMSKMGMSKMKISKNNQALDDNINSGKLNVFIIEASQPP